MILNLGVLTCPTSPVSLSIVGLHLGPINLALITLYFFPLVRQCLSTPTSVHTIHCPGFIAFIGICYMIPVILYSPNKDIYKILRRIIVMGYIDLDAYVNMAYLLHDDIHDTLLLP